MPLILTGGMNSRFMRLFSDFPEPFGNIGLVKPEVIVTEMAEAIFSDAPLETVIGPIKTVHGYHLIWIKKGPVNQIV